MSTPIRRRPDGGHTDPRLDQLRERLAAVRRTDRSAAAAAGRRGIAAAADRGHQVPPCRGRRAARRPRCHRRGREPGPGGRGEGGRTGRDLELRWHFIGQLQSNKAKSVVKYAHAVHSVDRLPAGRCPGQGHGRRAGTHRAGAAGVLHPGQPRRRRRRTPRRRTAGGRPGAGRAAGRLGRGSASRASWPWPRFGADPVPAFEKLAEHLGARSRQSTPAPRAFPRA